MKAREGNCFYLEQKDPNNLSVSLLLLVWGIGSDLAKGASIGKKLSTSRLSGVFQANNATCYHHWEERLLAPKSVDQQR